MTRLIDHLRSLNFSNRDAKNLLSTGKVSYCGIPTGDGGRDVDVLRVVINQNAPRLHPGRDLAIIYRDPDMIVIYKPSGMLSVASPGRRDVKNVIGVVRHILGDAYPVHRLDEATSGLMMVALNEHCQLLIKDMLFKHQIERGYLAIVAGLFPKKPCTERTKFVRNRGDGLRGSRPKVQATRGKDEDEDSGREAVTHFKLLEHLGEKASLVEARLGTGRTHQVRIHLYEKHYPVLGDDLYAPQAAMRAAPRLALHAYKLGLKHPITGKNLSFESPLADDLEILRRSFLRRIVV